MLVNVPVALTVLVAVPVADVLWLDVTVVVEVPVPPVLVAVPVADVD